jgi:superfamily II DNA or RNA helicase
MPKDSLPSPALRLQDVSWPRFLTAPDARLLEDLYVPALSRAVRYDRVCGYFSSRVLATAARGFGGLIGNLLAMGDAAPRPAVRLLVNEQLDPDDMNALLATGDISKLEKQLLAGLKTPTELLQKNRLQMLAWMVKVGLLDVRVGLMRRTNGVSHAKFGIIEDAHGDILSFMGSDNETQAALVENYEELQLVSSWKDAEFTSYYRHRFDTLWEDDDKHVQTVPLPDAVRAKLITFAPAKPPHELLHAPEQMRAKMVWNFLAAAAYLPDGGAACDATALVDMWPHQRRVVEDTSAAFPVGRLLCDEVGMGKTVEAILTLRRLIAGRGVRRALLMVPAGLLRQWQDELREKGGLIVPRWDSGTTYWPDGRSEKEEAFDALDRHDLLLISREWARLPNNRSTLLVAPSWDLVLLDEAHAARRAIQEERDFNSNNLLLELLRQLQLRRRTRGLLLLSATPMQTQPWEPWDLLAVLGVGGPWQVDFDATRTYYQAIADLKQQGLDHVTAQQVADLATATSGRPPLPVSASFHDNGNLADRLVFAPPAERVRLADWLRQASPLAQRMHRNTRQTLRRYFERGTLATAPPRREVKDVLFDYAVDAERVAYKAIETYINKRYEQLEKEKAGKGFVMTIYRRRASSSPLALQRSLQRRRDTLDKIIQQHQHSDFLSFHEEGLDVRDLGDLDVDEQIDAGLPTSPTAAQAEKKEVSSLLAQLEALNTTDSKLARFWPILQEVAADGRAVLVFTEYTDTMEYLKEQLRPTYGSTLGCYSGGGGQIWQNGAWITVTKADITERLSSGEIKVLICTDAASEGLNLQAASALINYDLPWNPSKVEQRIGRIDRIGQRQSVLPVRNLFLVDSVDVEVYGALRKRCGLFEHFVGPMQPVLALARDAFRRNLRPEQLPAFLSDLERRAATAQADVVTVSAYTESEAEEVSTVIPPVTRSDLAWALSLISESVGKVRAKKRKDGTWKVTGVSAIKAPLTLEREALERSKELTPLTLVGDTIGHVADQLPLPSSSPLVIAHAEANQYRAYEARWVGKGAVETVTSLAQLRQLIDAWDGALPSASLLFTARIDAQAAAQERVAAMKQAADAAQQADMDAQLEAARLRLLRELARTLRCLGDGDLSKLLQQQLQLKTPSGERFRKAFRLLGGPPKWSERLDKEATRYVADLTDYQRQQRINLASQMEAALNDPRWLAVKTPAR